MSLAVGDYSLVSQPRPKLLGFLRRSSHLDVIALLSLAVWSPSHHTRNQTLIGRPLWAVASPVSGVVTAQLFTLIIPAGIRLVANMRSAEVERGRCQARAIVDTFAVRRCAYDARNESFGRDSIRTERICIILTQNLALLRPGRIGWATDRRLADVYC